MKIDSVDIPKEAMILNAFDTIDYADAYTANYQFDKHIPLESIVTSFFLSFPFWVLWLMRFRDFLVSFFGLKKPDENTFFDEIERFKGEIGDSISLFKVYDKKANEMLTGVNDKHLDFRISFLLDPADENSKDLTIATIVQFNNLLGRIYFLAVRPFHKLVIPSILKRMVRTLNRA